MKNSKIIKVYRGAIDQVKFHNLSMWGPIGNSFFVTQDKNLAISAANGKIQQVLEYDIPLKSANAILGLKRPYIGNIQINESTEYIICGEEIKKIHQFLKPKQRLSPY